MTSLILACTLAQALPASALTQSESDWRQYQKAAEAALQQGQIASAEDLYRKTVDEAERLNLSPAELAKCQNGLAAVLLMEDKIEEAQALYKKSLALLEKAFGDNDARLVQTMLDLGSIYESQGNHAQAMALYNRVLSIDDKTFGPDHAETGRTMHRLASLKDELGKPVEAESLYKKATVALDKPDSQSDLRTCLEDYAKFLNHQRRKQEAQELSTKAQNILNQAKQQIQTPAQASSSAWQLHIATIATVAKQAQTNEEDKVLNLASQSVVDNQKLAPNYSTLADVYFKKNHYSDALSMYQTILAIDEKTLGDNHPGVADDLVNLAQLEIANKQLADAEPLIKRALRIYQNNYGDNNLLVVKTESLLAWLYEEEGKTQDAESLYKTALDLGQRALGPNNIETAKILNNLAYLNYKQGKYTDADTLYKWALASTEGALGENDPAVAACLQDYANVLHKLDRNEEADNMEQQAKTILSQGR